MLRPLVITQLLHLPWARKQVISGFLAQGKRKSCVITNGLNIIWGGEAVLKWTGANSFRLQEPGKKAKMIECARQRIHK